MEPRKVIIGNAEDTCCKRPAIVNMDHWRGTEFDKVWTTNRMCGTCGKHWYGVPGAETAYTRAEWDRWISTALDDTPPPTDDKTGDLFA